MPSILHVIQLYHPVKSGAGRYMEEIGARLAAEGEHVIALSTDAHDLEHFWLPGRRQVSELHQWQRGVEIIRLPIQRIPGPALLYPALRRIMAELARIPGNTPILRQLARLTPRWPGVASWLDQHGPFKLIHLANITLDFALLPVLTYAKQKQIPVIATPFVHLGVPGDQSLLRYYTMPHQIELLKQCDHVLTMTNLESTELERRGVAAERLKIIGAGVDPAEIAGGDAERFRQEQQIQGPILLYIGALARDKGAVDTVEAMRQLWAQGSQATLVMIGAPLAHFQSYIEGLQASERTNLRILPYAPDSTKRDALAACEIFVMPSRTDSFGIVYLEAWCYQKPVIGARAGGVPGLISDGKDGMLVPYGEPLKLARALETLLANPDLRQHLGQAGQAKVTEQYTWEHVYQRVRGIYQQYLH